MSPISVKMVESVGGTITPCAITVYSSLSFGEQKRYWLDKMLLLSYMKQLPLQIQVNSCHP